MILQQSNVCYHLWWFVIIDSNQWTTSFADPLKSQIKAVMAPPTTIKTEAVLAEMGQVLKFGWKKVVQILSKIQLSSPVCNR